LSFGAARRSLAPFKPGRGNVTTADGKAGDINTCARPDRKVQAVKRRAQGSLNVVDREIILRLLASRSQDAASREEEGGEAE